MEKYIIVAHMPACSAVLFVNPNLEDPHKVTILVEQTRNYCVAYAEGFSAGSGLEQTGYRGSMELPAGNPAQSFTDRMLQLEAQAEPHECFSDARTWADGKRHCQKCGKPMERSQW